MDTPTDATIDGFAHVQVSEHIDVYYDESEHVVAVAVDGRRVVYCAFLVASIVPSSVASDAVTSIDALAITREARRLEGMEAEECISPEEQVRAHASNLQAWVEHDYDTHLLHSSIAFTLLKALTDVGDDKARRVLEGSIDERLHDGTSATRIAIADLACRHYSETGVLYLSQEQIDTLLADPDTTVRKVASWLPLTPAQFMHVLADPDPGVQESMNKHHQDKDFITWTVASYEPGDLPGDVIEALATSEYPGRRALAAWIKELPAHLIERLAEDDDVIVREIIARRQDLLEDVVARLATDASNKVRQALAKQLNLPAASIDTLLHDEDAYVRTVVASVPRANYPLDALARLAETDKAIEYGIAGNPNLPIADIERLARSPDGHTRVCIARRTSLHHEITTLLANDEYSSVRFEIAKNKGTAPEILDKLASDPDPDVRKEVLYNSNTPASTFVILTIDTNPKIGSQAKIRLLFENRRYS